MARRSLTAVTQLGTLMASDGATNDNLGVSVAVSGNTLVVGAPYADIVEGGITFTDRGALYVFTKPAGGTWADATQQAKLTIADYTGGGEQLGTDVAIDGDTIVAVAPSASQFREWDRSASGAAFVFTKPEGGWTNAIQSAKLIASDGQGQPTPDRMGNSISISGDTVVVGVPGSDGAGTDSGAAYVFTKPGGGWSSIVAETVKLTVPEAPLFGMSVAVENDTIVAGALNNNGSNAYQGSVHVFTRPSGGSWTSAVRVAVLTAADGGNNDQLGSDVAIQGDTIAAGARYGGNFRSNGAVYVFGKPVGGWTDATQTAKLTTGDLASNSLGQAVAISGNTIVAGAPEVNYNDASYGGAAYVFTKPDGSPWVDVDYTSDPQPTKLTSSPILNYSFFGSGVAVAGGTIFVGHPGSNVTPPNYAEGAVYVFGDDTPPPPPVVPDVSIADASTDEGNVGTGQLSFVVTMSASSAVDVTVQYQTADAGATDGSDYAGASSVLTIPAGETTAAISIPIIRDTAYEADETFTLELFNASNAAIGDGLATGTIRNDDRDGVCLVSTPILEYRFNNSGTTSTSTGSDTTPVTFKHPAGTVIDLHGGPGSGLSGQAADIAFDNTQQVNDGVSGSFGHGGYGDRAEQLVDDEAVDALASVTFQGWFKSNDPVSVTGNGGILFNKSDGVAPGAGFSIRWNTGSISASLVSSSGSGYVESPPTYLSANQWIFFAITYDGTASSGNVKFYQGTLSQPVALIGTASVDVGAMRNVSLDRLALGNGTNGVRTFPALFDNMRIFGSQTADSGVLTLAELEAFRSADTQNDGVATLIGCDSTPPAITPDVSGTPGNNGWYVSDVQVTWSVIDNESAVSSATGCDATSITTDTAGVTLTCSATSDGGTTTESVTIKRDTAVPSASAGASPAANASNWRNTNVTVTFSGSDALSGLAGCDPAVVLSSNGTNQSASGRCYDNAGNQSALATAGGINIDKTPPTATATARPAANKNGWRKGNVTVSFTGADALSGLASCDPAITVSTEGANMITSGKCYDLAGNESAPATVVLSIDKTAPTITMVTPANGAVYNRNQVVTADYSCADSLSTIATCSGQLANGAGIDTSRKANNAKFTVTATDKAGNSTKVTVTYSVR